jgi:very-short-patch-repair endonuclease
MVRQTRLTRAARDQRAQELRLEMSATEWRLWYRLRGRQLMLRSSVVQVDENIAGVIETIADALSGSDLHGPSPASPRAAGGGRRTE